jgi:hypothetical protein
MSSGVGVLMRDISGTLRSSRMTVPILAGGAEMAEFETVYDYLRFESRTSGHFRYFRDAEMEQFLSTVLATASRRISVLKKGKFVWRAQSDKKEPVIIENDGSVAVTFFPFDADRMKPRPAGAKEGRVNPKGIPVLYVATSPETAMSEIRPSRASALSLAELEICRDLKLVDCTMNSSSRSPFYYPRLPVPSANEREEVVWGSINFAFTRPVDASDSVAEYAPTQVLAEYFKSAGYDGLRYKSSYGATGQNIALFALQDATVRHVKLMRVKSINIEFTDW